MKRIREENINTTHYWDNFANSAYTEADRKRGGNLCKFGTVIQHINTNYSILDVGCLNGNFYNYIVDREFACSKFTGVDFSPKLISLAKERFPDQEWQVASCYELPFADNLFDYVTAMELFEHIDDPLRALLELQRVCREDGTIILTTPNSLKIDDAAHVFSFEPGDIFSLLSSISSDVRIRLTCSNNRNIVGIAVNNYKKPPLV